MPYTAPAPRRARRCSTIAGISPAGAWPCSPTDHNGWLASGRSLSAPPRSSQRRTGSGNTSVASRSRSSDSSRSAPASGAASRSVQAVGGAR